MAKDKKNEEAENAPESTPQPAKVATNYTLGHHQFEGQGGSTFVEVVCPKGDDLIGQERMILVKFVE